MRHETPHQVNVCNRLLRSNLRHGVVLFATLLRYRRQVPRVCCADAIFRSLLGVCPVLFWMNRVK